MKKHLVSLALVLGILFFSLSAVAQPQEQPKEPKPIPRGLAALKENLNLTPEQEAKVKDFQKARAEERKASREQMRKVQSELRDLLKDPKADQKKIDGLIDQLSKIRADRFKAMLQQRKEFQKLFTPEQQEKLKNLRERFANRGMMRQRFARFGRFAPGQGRFFAPGQFRGRHMLGPCPWRRGWGHRHRMFCE